MKHGRIHHSRRRVAVAATVLMAVGLVPMLPAAAATPPSSAPADVSAEGISIVTGTASYQSRRTGGSALYDATSDTTYVAWSSNGMDVHIRGYSHTTESWSTPVLVGEWDRNTPNAYHDYTMLEMLPDGRLAVFVARHTVSLTMFTTPNPHDIDGTWSRQVISTDKTTYPEPVVIGSDVYVFYSQNTNLSWPYRTYRYIKSYDNGATWSSPVTAIDTGQTADRFNEVYTLSADPIDGKACFTWTLAGGSGHNAQARDLYAACFDPTTSTMSSLDGQNLEETIDAAEHAAARVISAPTTSTFPRPMTLAAITQDPVTEELVIGAGYYKDGVRRIDVGRVESGGGITWANVDDDSRSFLDIAWNDDAGAAEVLSADGSQARVRTHLVDTNESTVLTDVAIPYGNSGADAVWVANYVEDRQNLSYIGYTINVATRDSNYSGTWPVFAGWSEHPTQRDLAEGRPATASSVKNDNPERVPAKAFDGDPGTRWGSEYVNDSWLQVDLNATTSIDRIRLHWEVAYGEEYKIQVSDDAIDWDDVRTVTDGDGGIDHLTDLEAEGRYVRMQGIKRGTQYGYSLYSFEVYGGAIDLAEGATTVGSSVAGDNATRQASNATDGHSGTRWASTYTDPSWIQIDLGAPVAISSIVLDWEAAYGQEYKIQVSDDAVDWSNVIYETTAGVGGRELISGLAGEGRYVRLYGTKRGTPYGYSLWSVEVYGTR